MKVLNGLLGFAKWKQSCVSFVVCLDEVLFSEIDFKYSVNGVQVINVGVYKVRGSKVL